MLPIPSLTMIISSLLVIGRGSGTVHPPFSLNRSHIGWSVDMSILSLHVVGASSILGAINFTAAMFNMRHVGTTLDLISLFV